MLTAAKLVLPALAAALFVWGAAWCVVRTLRPQMADTAAVGGEPPRSSKAMAALAGLVPWAESGTRILFRFSPSPRWVW